MSSYTTVEADPKGAASFLKALRRKEEQGFHPDQQRADWFTRSAQEVKERLGRDSFWDNPSPVGKGWDYERLAGVNIGGSHPVIDDVRAYDGIVTSMKVMDTHAESYQFVHSIEGRGKSYVDAFEKFTGVHTADGFELALDQIQGYHLEIAVRTDIVELQRQELKNVQEYGRQHGVRVIIAEVA